MKKKKIGVWAALLILPIALLVLTAFIQFAVRLSFRNSCPTTVQSSSGTLSSGPGLQTYDSSTNLQEVTTDTTKCDTPSVVFVVNLVCIFVGVIAVLMILGAPLWIVMLIRAAEYNRKLSNAPPTTTPATPQPPVDSGPPHYPLVG